MVKLADLCRWKNQNHGAIQPFSTHYRPGNRIRISVLCFEHRDDACCSPSCWRIFSIPSSGSWNESTFPARWGRCWCFWRSRPMFSGLGYLVVDRAEQFVDGLAALQRRPAPRHDGIRPPAVHGGKAGRGHCPCERKRACTASRAVEPPPVRAWLFHGVGSLYSILLVATFVPFLVFFMLAAKRRIWKATMELFPDEHQDARERGAG